MKTNTKLLLWLCGLQTFDVLITWFGLTSKYTVEGNAVADWIIHNLGWFDLWAIKIIGVLFFFLLTKVEKFDKLMTRPLKVCNGIMAFVGIYNVVLLTYVINK